MLGQQPCSSHALTAACGVFVAVLLQKGTVERPAMFHINTILLTLFFILGSLEAILVNLKGQLLHTIDMECSHG